MWDIISQRSSDGIYVSDVSYFWKAFTEKLSFIWPSLSIQQRAIGFADGYATFSHSHEKSKSYIRPTCVPFLLEKEVRENNEEKKKGKEAAWAKRLKNDSNNQDKKAERKKNRMQVRRSVRISGNFNSKITWSFSNVEWAK